MLELGCRQTMTGKETKRARGKCIANALVCQLCWTFLFTTTVVLYCCLFTITAVLPAFFTSTVGVPFSTVIYWLLLYYHFTHYHVTLYWQASSDVKTQLERRRAQWWTMTTTNHDDQLGEIYPTTLNEPNCTYGVSFSCLHCCGHHGCGLCPSWLWPSWFVAVIV